MSILAEKISAEEFSNFLTGSRRSFFSQSPEGLVWNRLEGLRGELYGLRLEGEIAACAKVLFLRYKKIFYSAEINFAPLVKRDDPELFGLFVKHLTKLLFKNRRVLRVRITPMMQTAYYHDLEKTADEPKAEAYASALRSCGYTELKEDFYDRPGGQARFLYSKDISGMREAEVFESLQYRARNDMQRAKRYGIKVRLLAPDELELFNRLMRDTAERTGMKPWLVTYADAKIVQAFGDKVCFPLAYLDCKEALTAMNEEEAAFKYEIRLLREKGENKKILNKIKGIEEQLEALCRRRDEVMEMEQAHGASIDLAAAQFCFSPSDCIYLQSAVDSRFTHLSPAYAIHEFMIPEAVRRGCGHYNFFAVADPFSEQSEDKGVLAFKRRFNGDLEEYMGTWERFSGPLTAAVLRKVEGR